MNKKRYQFKHLSEEVKSQYFSGMKRSEWNSYINRTEDIPHAIFQAWCKHQKEHWEELENDQQNRLKELGILHNVQDGATFDEAEAKFNSLVNTYDKWQKREGNKGKTPRCRARLKEERQLYNFLESCLNIFRLKTSWAKDKDERKQKLKQLKAVGLDLEAIIRDRKLKRNKKQDKSKVEERERRISKLDPAYLDRKFKKVKLQQMCRDRGLLVTGYKENIIERIIEHDAANTTASNKKTDVDDSRSVTSSKRSTRSSAKKDESAASIASQKRKRRRLT